MILGKLVLIYILIFCNGAAWGKTSKASLLIIIRGQSDIFNHKIAYDQKLKIEEDIEKYNIKSEVLLSHREWPVEAAWSITPLIPDISVRYGDKYQWVMVVDDRTTVNINKLVSSVLPRYDYDDHLLLGRCLHDETPTIIHHFAFFDGDTKSFKYPDLDAGLIISTGLLRHIQEEWRVDNSQAHFQIDVKHELAKLLYDQYDVSMTCVKELCGADADERCVTRIEGGKMTSQCGGMASLDRVQFSVKTTAKFHTDRVPVVKKTWGRYLKRATYYSNVTDEDLGTIDCGVPNTETGHCGKMEKIIRDADKMEDLDWLVIADDDTIMSVSRMLEVLNCYNFNSPIVLGERYGFGLNTGYGYSYITGGGGMVMSRRAVADFVKKGCKCPIISAPDDMYLGQCFSNTVGIPVVHSPLFHQARPNDYSTGFLGNQLPISFHKHWMNDPIKVYKKWFANADKVAFPDVDTSDLDEVAKPVKDEL